jgi:HAD superfamily hydrolase (TIGR01509 family)
MQCNRLISRDVDAVIFDMDGLMLDTERLGREHFRRAAADFGYLEIDAVYLQTVGRNGPDTRKIFHEEFGGAFPFDEVRRRWRQYSKAHAVEFGVPVKPGLERLLGFLKGLSIPKAVATSTRRGDATALLEKASVLHHFNAIVAGDEVTNGKPAPDIFIMAAERLNAVPARCVVFEDSPAGIQASHAAGMIPILVPDQIAPRPETIGIAYRILSSLEEAPDLFEVAL